MKRKVLRFALGIIIALLVCSMPSTIRDVFVALLAVEGISQLATALSRWALPDDLFDEEEEEDDD